jgi:outer membrane murein-binding lipoprotein Lpp
MVIVRNHQAMRLVALVLGFGSLVSLTGCDYWPPALQAQVEQLRSETQTLATEKAQLQVQINDISNARREMQSQLDEMGRLNREKTEIINSLQRQVDSLRSKAVKAVAPSKVSAKPTTKSSGKQPTKKPAPIKR